MIGDRGRHRAHRFSHRVWDITPSSVPLLPGVTFVPVVRYRRLMQAVAR